jgi:type I restriction enzyme S subunit
MSDKFDEFVETKLGRFTSDWHIVKFGDIYPSLTTGSTPSRSKPEYFQGDILWVTSGELKYNVICDTWEKLTSQAVRDTNLRLYPPGTFFIAITGLEAAGTRGSCAIIGKEATTNQSCMAFVANDRIDTNFLFQFYRCFGEAVAFTYSQGTKQQSLNGNIVRSIEIPLPPLPQQRKIARILTTVDNLIEKTEALIAKYQAIKQGIMHDLFTRGVDEHGHLRPPYEEAPELYKQSELGWIPKEWNCVSVASHVDLQHGYQFRDYDFVPNGIPVIKIGNVTSQGLDLGQLTYIGSERLNEFQRVIINNGDVLMSLTGNIGRVVEVGGLTSPVLQNYRVGKFVPHRPELTHRFMKHILSSGSIFSQLDKYANQSAQANFGKQDLERLSMPLPNSCDEQNAICSFIESMATSINIEQVTLLKLCTLKTGLMQDLLTGKVRVKVDEAKEVAAHD